MPLQPSNVLTAPANPNHVGMVTIEGYTISITYLPRIRVGNAYEGVSFSWDSVRPIPYPFPGWENCLEAAVRNLQDTTHNIGALSDYLPIGSLVVYRPNGQDSSQIPAEVGIADEIAGKSLEKLVSVVELWLERKLKKYRMIA